MVFPLTVRGKTQRVVATVEHDELRFDHDVPIDLQISPWVRLDASVATWEQRYQTRSSETLGDCTYFQEEH